MPYQKNHSGSIQPTQLNAIQYLQTIATIFTLRNAPMKYEKGVCGPDSIRFPLIWCRALSPPLRLLGYRNPPFPSPPILSLAEPQYSALVAPGGFQDTGGGIISPASAFARINTKPRKNISEDLKWALAMLILQPISRRQSPPKILRFKTMFYMFVFSSV